MRIPRTKRGLFAYISAIFVLTFSVLAAANTSTPLKIAQAPSKTQETAVLGINEESVLVTKVVDGDTFEIEGGRKVRLIGIDTPETVDPRRAIGCFGKEASDHLKEILTGKTVRLVRDVSNTDSFGRLLRYVYVEDLFINKILVWDGYAVARSYPPDIAHQIEFRDAERQARENSKGLWGSACSGQKLPKSDSTTTPKPKSTTKPQ